MQRAFFVGGNWKMNMDSATAPELARAVAEGLAGVDAEVVVYPPFPYLTAVRDTLHATKSGVRLGGQNLSDELKGAFTGEVSGPMLKDCGCRSVLIGHSERRHVIGEDDEFINRKVLRAFETGLQVVLCVGETLEERESKQTNAVNERQLRHGLKGVPKAVLERLIIAYEPVWAIGTGKSATARDAQEAHGQIRLVLTEIFDEDAGRSTRVIYGGSVKAANAGELFAQPDIDGGLIGGASLDAEEFVAIVRAGGEKDAAA